MDSDMQYKDSAVGPSCRFSRRFVAKLVSAAVLTVALALPAVGEPVPDEATAFTEYVAGRIRTVLTDAPVVVQGPLTVKLGDLQANLNRIFEFCQRNSSACPAEIATFVTGVAETYKSRNGTLSRDAIRVVVRSTLYVQKVQNSLGPDAPALLPAPFVEGLVLLPVLDLPRTFRLLNAADLKTLGLSEPEVQQLGLSNLRDEIARKPLMDIAKVARAGEIGQLVGDVFNPSRLALHDTWAPLAKAQGGKLIVAAPASDAVFYVGDDSPAAIDALRAMVRTVMGRAPHPLSEILQRWTPTGWEVVH